MLRLRIFGSGRVMLSDEKGAVVDEFIVPDPEKAQEIVMKKLQEINNRDPKCSECGGRWLQVAIMHKANCSQIATDPDWQPRERIE